MAGTEPRLTDDICSEVLLSLDREARDNDNSTDVDNEVQNQRLSRQRLPTSIFPEGMESSSWQWPKGVVAGAIPNSYYPMPAIEDEVEDFFNDKELQSTVKKSTMEEYLREAHSRLYEPAGGFKSAYVAVGALGRFKGTIVEMEKGETGEGEGSKTEEEGETGRGKDEGGRGLDGAPLGAPVVPVTRKRQLKVSVRLCNSSSRTNVIDYRQIDSKVKQMVIPHVSNFLQRQPTFVARATFPRFLREDIGDRPDGNNFQVRIDMSGRRFALYPRFDLKSNVFLDN